MNNKPQLIAIFGTGRNGSTLLLRLLDGMPKTYCHPLEIKLLSALNDLAKLGKVKENTSSNASIELLRYLEKPIKTETLVKYYFSYQIEKMKEMFLSQIPDIKPNETAIEEIKKNQHYDAKSFTEVFMNSMADWLDGENLEKIIFKTIETPYIADYEKLFPQMKFIHIIRDPIETWSSAKRSLMLKKPLLSCHLGWDNLKTMIEKRWIPHAKTIVEKRNNPRHFLVKYEDLIQSPLKIIAEICQWLGTELPGQPEKQTVLGGRFVEKLFAEPSQKGVETPVEVISDLKKRFQYDEVITKREKNFIVWRLLGLAKQIGYLANEKKPSGFKIFIQWLLPDKWEFLNADNLKKIIKCKIAFFLRRFYIWSKLIKNR